MLSAELEPRCNISLLGLCFATELCLALMWCELYFQSINGTIFTAGINFFNVLFVSLGILC